MKKLFLMLALCAILPVLVSCEDDDKDSIDLDKKEIILDIDGNEKLLTITANGYWEIKNIPDWMNIEPDHGDSSSEIKISAIKNNESTRKKAVITFVRGNASKTLELDQQCIMDLDPFIQLDEKKLQMNVDGQVKKVKLTTNKSWNITEIPDWVIVNPTSGDGTAEITIQVNEYRQPESRDVKLKFTADTAKEELLVAQYGLKDYIRDFFLPITKFEGAKMSAINSSIKECSVETRNLFINSGIKDKVYTGSLLSHNVGSVTDIPQFTGYTYNQITVSPDPAITKSITYIPSMDKQNAYAQEIISKKPKQSQSFIADKEGKEFYTYKQLHGIGKVNLGENLDELISGSSYTEKEMTKKYGMIYSFKQTIFSIGMDFQDDVIKEELTAADKARGVSYVNTVTYGRLCLLVVESDTDSRIVRTAINKVISDEDLTAEETNLILSASITCVHYNNNKEIQIKKGNMDAIETYLKVVDSTIDNIYPLDFTLMDMSGRIENKISYSFQLP